MLDTHDLLATHHDPNSDTNSVENNMEMTFSISNGGLQITELDRALASRGFNSTSGIVEKI